MSLFADEAWLVRADGSTAYIKRKDEHLFFCAYHTANMPTGGQSTSHRHSEEEAIAHLTESIGITPDDVWHTNREEADR